MLPMLSSAPEKRDPRIKVGTLSLWDSTTHETSRPLEVYSNYELFIGRDPKRCQFHLTNPFVSNKHVRIYTILFDQDNLDEIPPLVYAQDLSMNGTFWNEYRMGKGKDSFLLSDGDILRVAVGIHIQFKSSDTDKESKFSQLQQLEMKRFQESYVITQRMLGSGAYGRVHMAFNRSTGQQFACKVVDLKAVRADLQAQAIEAQSALREQQQSKFFAMQPQPRKFMATTGNSHLLRKAVLEKIAKEQRESLLLAELSHPNIITIEKIFRSSNTIYMFTELVTCGDLFSFVRNRGTSVEEMTTALIVRQILLALEYLHDRNIVHRDVKPDNILMKSLNPGGRVVLADFGCARLVKQPVQRMSSVVGTPEYCAPELLRTNIKGYTKAVDMWSLGCVAAVLLVGDIPFDKTRRFTTRDLMNMNHDMRALGISPEARDFVLQLLVLDETKRMDVKQALRHDWFTNPARAGWFKQMYDRSIQDWKPRNSSESVMVELTSCKSVQPSKRLHSESLSSWSPKEGARFADVDYISETSWENVADSHTRPLISPVVSKPAPAMKTPCRSQLVSLEPNSVTKMKPQESIKSDANVKFLSQVQREQLGQSQLERPALNMSSCDSPSVQKAGSKKELASTGGKQAAKAKFTINKNTGVKNFFLSSHSAAFASIPNMQTTAPKTSPKDGSDESVQVYEEVCNPITGKRKRLIYGWDMIY